MSTTITITKSIDVDIDTVDERDSGGRYARVAVIPATKYADARTVATATIYERDAAPDGTSRFTVTGNFVDNYAVEAKVRAYADGAIDGVSFDSEQGQFFAYTKDVVAAERLATAVVKAAVAVALEAGAL
jgi:hypothetical protein